MSIEKLRKIVAILRSPDGCPWDREQTHESLLSGFMEECYELMDAVQSKHLKNFREELGDVLLHVVMQAQIAEEAGQFTLDQVSEEIADKLIRRHPHVFGKTHVVNSAEVAKQWDKIKAEEKKERTSVMDGIAGSLPALAQAQQVGKKAAKVGFDWDNIRDVIAKIREELDEVEVAVRDDDNIEEEIGDLLFAVTNLARKTGIDSELSLRAATQKFIRRFLFIEDYLKQTDTSWASMDLTALDVLWGEAKRLEKISHQLPIAD